MLTWCQPSPIIEEIPIRNFSSCSVAVRPLRHGDDVAALAFCELKSLRVQTAHRQCTQSTAVVKKRLSADIYCASRRAVAN